MIARQAVHRHKSVELTGQETERVHRERCVELEEIEINMGGKLKLKIFAYPIKTTVYHNRLAFVVFYEYKTTDGIYKNIDESSKVQPRFWINIDQDISELAKSGRLILVSPTYQELRSRIVQEAVFNSANAYSKKQSKNNIDWFNENRRSVSKRQTGAGDFARDKKRIERPIQTTEQKLPVFIPDKIEETPFTEIIEIPNVQETIEVDSIKEVEVIVTETQPLVQTKNKQFNVQAPANIIKGKSSGLRNFLKKHAA